jgi:type I restriction enzyme M protein
MPQETFSSSGANVKASLLFLQKFTAKEQADFDRKHAKAHKEIEAKYAPEIAKETSRLQGLMASMKASRDMIFDQFDGWRRELRDYERMMADTMASETRALLKERFPYPIFLYEAGKVGITATGEPDQNELFPNDNLPTGVTKTALEFYREFRRNPEALFLAEAAL